MIKEKSIGKIIGKIIGIVLLCLLGAALVVGGIWAYPIVKNHLNNVYTLEMVYEGQRDVTVEYGESYQEPGVTACFSGTHLQTEPVPVEVIVTGEVNDQVLGTYVLKYTARYEEYVRTDYRRIYVVDTKAPEITLVADPEKYTLPTETYVEEGFTATDNYDGDITDRVIRKETREQVTYTVYDSSGNKAVVTRQIVYDDPIPPELTLKGEQTVTLNQGQTYKEPGFTATDNCDGDLTEKVAVTGRVDKNKPGNYVLTYSVMDAYENLTSVSRTVYVKPKKNTAAEKPTVVVPNGKVIYLTFDDGPGYRTPELLDVLKKYNVKATFFVVNTAYISTIKRASEEGHSIGIHSVTHDFHKIYASEAAYLDDLYTMRDIIKKHTGVETTLLRFPGGGSNTISRFNKGIMTRLTELVQEEGFQYFDWNVDSNDAGGASTSEEVFENVTGGIGSKKYSVVLQHDIKGFSIEAVEKIIQWGLKNGYTFLPLIPTSPGCHHRVNN